MGVWSRYAAASGPALPDRASRRRSFSDGDILRLGVAPGRPFPPLDNMLRVTIGTDAEMAKFRDVFWKVYQG
jgi:hypothetical protein